MFLIAHTFAENANKPEIAYMVSPSFHILSFQSREYIFFCGESVDSQGCWGIYFAKNAGKKREMFFRATVWNIMNSPLFWPPSPWPCPRSCNLVF